MTGKSALITERRREGGRHRRVAPSRFDGLKFKMQSVGPVFLLTLISQGLSTIGLIFVPFIGGAIADTYSLAIQIGSASYAGIVLGVTYNLAIGRPDYRYWKLSNRAAICFPFVLGVIVAIFLWLSDSFDFRSDPFGVAPILLSYVFGGAALAGSSTLAVRAACQSRPLTLAGISIVPNAVSAVSFPLVSSLAPDGSAMKFVPAVAWMLASLIVWCWVATKLSLESPIPTAGSQNSQARDSRARYASNQKAFADGDRSDSREHALALVAGVVASSIMPTLLLTALTQLPAGQTAIVFLVSKVGGSIIGLGVNTLLLVQYNWNTAITRSGVGIEYLVTASLLLVVPSFLVDGFVSSGFADAALGVSWVLGLIAMAFVLREANARKMARAISVKTALDIAFSIFAAWILFDSPSVSNYFCALLVSQFITLCVIAHFLRRQYSTFVALLGLALVLANLVV